MLNESGFTQIGYLFIDDFFVVGLLLGPGIDAGSFDRSIFTDEDVGRTNISYLFAPSVK